jgi:multimeric flavodoxin WrbA
MPPAAPRPSILIVWHSRTGASEAMAKAAAEGARGEVDVVCLNAQDAMPDHILNASAYLFVCPENLGGMSGMMKEFFDRCYYDVIGRTEGRAYATLIAAGSDGEGAQRQIDRIVTGWRLRRVLDPVIINFDAQDAQSIQAAKTVSPADLARCHEIGATLGAALALGMY